MIPFRFYLITDRLHARHDAASTLPALAAQTGSALASLGLLFSARSLGYLRPSDLIAMNRDRQIADAKQTALAMVRAGYHPPAPAEIRVLGEEFFAAAKLAVHMMIRGEYATEYDGVVARKLAYILAGGRITAPQTVPEQYILDLEREAFVSLCGERKTQERIAHTLKTGKPLRN